MGPRGVAIDAAAGRIYWSSQGDNAIRCAPLAGGSVVDRLYGPSGVVSLPGGVAIDPAAGGRIYWANEVDDTIRGAPLAGGGTANALYGAYNGVKSPGAVAIDPAAGRIYWTNGDNTIRGAGLAGGSNPDTLYSSSQGVNGPSGLAIDPAAGRIYWSNFLDNTIRGAPLTVGGRVTTLYGQADGVHAPTGIAIDPPEPVFAILDESRGSALSRWVRPVMNWAAERWPGSRPAGRIYWANSGDNTIRGAPLDGGGPVDTLYDGPDHGVFGPNFVAVLRAPVGTGPPTISVAHTPGEPLRCSRGTWARDLLGAFLYRAPQSFRYQWARNGADIGGATLSHYMPNAPGSYTCRVTATNQAGSAAQTSAAVAI
jgi:DNA-binding beta-propeller fold protein YncE